MNHSILYVEDEPFLGRIVKESLESRGYTITMVTDGAEAMRAFAKILPDLCILDVMLPHKDGFSIATEIRTISPQVPIIFVTAKNQTEDLLTGFKSGGNDYIRKPFSMEELIVRINNLLTLARHHAPAPSGQQTLGKYTFDGSRFELSFNGVVKKLSHRESTLLQMLIDKKNDTLNRKEILLKLWGDDSYFNSRNLDVYIAKLREYLKQDPAIEIVTVKGVGYHFVVS